jgi:hypothetical protein
LSKNSNWKKLNKIKGAFNIEIWKRKNARLAFFWNTEKFQETEVDLPQYTKIKKQRKKLKPHTKWQTFYFKNEVKLKYLVSFVVSLGMVGEKKRVCFFLISFLNMLPNIKASIVAFDILLTILYRVWVRVKILPHSHYGQIFFGESMQKYLSFLKFFEEIAFNLFFVIVISEIFNTTCIMFLSFVSYFKAVIFFYFCH